MTVGSVSMGDAEVVRQVLAAREGARFAPIAMQPGGPQGLATWGDTPVVCLPGNPVSALVSFVVLLRPVVLEAVGRAPIRPARARLSRDVTSPAGRVQYLRATLAPDGTADPVSGPGSHLVASMARADVVFLGRVALREPAWPQRAAAELGLDWRQAPYPPQYTRGKWA